MGMMDGVIDEKALVDAAVAKLLPQGQTVSTVLALALRQALAGGVPITLDLQIGGTAVKGTVKIG